MKRILILWAAILLLGWQPAVAGIIGGPNSPMAHGPLVDGSKLVPGDVGLAVDKVQLTDELPSEGGGAFRTTCRFSHFNFDDAIAKPGLPGASHLHANFGNTLTNAFSTYESLSTTGNSTCRGGTVNRTAYWVPATIDTRTGTPVVPIDSQFYYKLGDQRHDASQVQPIPAGLRMIAGDMANDAPSGPFYFNCKGGSNSMSFPNCAVGSELYQNLRFPQCWDGVNLDSPDHKSHMAYRLFDNLADTAYCPESHPVLLPEITFRIVYKVTEENQTTHWRLSSDIYDTSLPAGRSMHGDWYDGWKADVKDAWTTHCVRARKDCHSHLLGDGRRVSF